MGFPCPLFLLFALRAYDRSILLATFSVAVGRVCLGFDLHGQGMGIESVSLTLQVMMNL